MLENALIYNINPSKSYRRIDSEEVLPYFALELTERLTHLENPYLIICLTYTDKITDININNLKVMLDECNNSDFIMKDSIIIAKAYRKHNGHECYDYKDQLDILSKFGFKKIDSLVYLNSVGYIYSKTDLGKILIESEEYYNDQAI